MTILQKLYRTTRLRQFGPKKLAKLVKLAKLATHLFFLQNYYYHWLSISYNNYYFKYVPVQLVQLSNLSNFRIVFSLQTLSFIGAILGYINMCYIYYVLYIMLIYGLRLRNLWLCYGNCSWSHWEYEYISYIRCYKLLSHQAHNT